MNLDEFEGVYRFCSCPNGDREDPFLVHNIVLGVDICTHCGGILRPKEEEVKEFDYYKYYCGQARTCSIKNDHSTAIKFYNEALKHTYLSHEKWDVFSAIAGEYEEIEDYYSAEEYWNKCHELEQYFIESAPERIAKRGDFLYRRGRRQEAIDTYEKALKSLTSLKDNRIGLNQLKACAKICHSIIDLYYAPGEDFDKEKYHNELKHQINRYITKGRHSYGKENPYFLSKTAWDLYNDIMTDEALIFIDSAIKLNPNPPANDYNRKAIMLETKLRYEEALKYYDKALSKDKNNETFLTNKAGCIKEELKTKLLFNRIKPDDLNLIDKALKMLPKNYDNSTFLFTKAEILDQLGEPVKAKICNALSVKNYDEVDKAEKQLKKLKSSENYINITGIHHYQGFDPFKEGTIVDLIREPDNPHDRNAIRVEIKGETVGYVANSKYTVIEEVKSATDIKDTRSTRAEVQFILFNKWVIAKLI